MKGNVKIVVSTKRLRYELNLHRNITIIQGDSASGKTTLIQIISDYLSERTGPGTEVVCDRKCAVLSGDTESAIVRLQTLSDTVVFVDEQERFLYSKVFAETVLDSNCYFVFIKCDSAGGKSNVAKYILSNQEDVFAIVDGAAFGADMQSVMHALKVSRGSHIWTPESFEYLILQSGIVQSEGLKEIMETPGDFIESGEHSSWERYFTRLLEDITKNTIYSYSKKKLNPNFLTRGNINKMKSLMQNIGLFVSDIIGQETS